MIGEKAWRQALAPAILATLVQAERSSGGDRPNALGEEKMAEMGAFESELLGDGHLAIAEELVQKLGLKTGSKLKVSIAPRMTYEEFLAWADEDTLAEWVDGAVIVASPVSRQHQEIGGFLYKLLSTYAEVRGLGVVLPPFQMKLASSGREPDLLFIAQAHLDRLKETYLDGPADLVVEITSPEGLGRDRGDKFFEYEQAGIPEYWLIDPLRREAEFYRLDEHGRYRLAAPEADGTYHSRILTGLRLQLSWLWKPPPVLEALRLLRVL
jgi:Uma2 family endonuclease